MQLSVWVSAAIPNAAIELCRGAAQRLISLQQEIHCLRYLAS